MFAVVFKKANIDAVTYSSLICSSYCDERDKNAANILHLSRDVRVLGVCPLSKKGEKEFLAYDSLKGCILS
jgi:hypothetical protein